MSSTPRVWLITGASSGFGRALATAALSSGDIVVATARSTQALEELVTTYPGRLEALGLDVTDMDATQVVDDLVTRHGRIDVLVNNAGRTQVGALEETTEQELRYLFDAAAILTALAAERTPLRLPLGADAVEGIRTHLATVGEEITIWEPLSRSTSFDPD